jgi:DegV family protein with EDD domain
VSPSVAVVTDTTCCLPAEVLARHGVQRVSLYVGWDGDLRPERSFDVDEFYARLRDSDSMPATSQPSVGDFLECLEPLVADGRDVVSIHLALGLSGTCASAREAAAILAERGHPGRIEVIDAETGAAGLDVIVLAAAEAASAGADREGIAAAARETRSQLRMWFCLDTLEYLRRGGRIGGAQALVGSALQIKPILTFGDQVVPVGRVRTRKRAFERMLAYIHELHDAGATAWMIQHAQSPDDAQRLVEEGRKTFGTEPLFCTQVGPVLGAHLGSGLLVGGLVPATAA